MLHLIDLHALSTNDRCREYFEYKIQDTRQELSSLLVYFVELYMDDGHDANDVASAHVNDVSASM